MTKQEDAKLNTDNPLILKSESYGGDGANWLQHDDNFLNLMRSAGDWTSRTHIKGEVVKHADSLWIATQDTAVAPPDATWYNLLPEGGMTWKDAWSPLTNYVIDNVVWYRGGSWVALVDNTNVEPIGVSTWAPLVGPMGRLSMGINSSKNQPNMGIAWQVLNDFDVELTTAIGGFVDLEEGFFTFTYPGLWLFNISVSIDHDSDNAGRHFYVRMFNESTQLPYGSGYRVGTGRNATVSNVNTTVQLPITLADLSQNILVQYGDGSTYSDVIFTSQSISVTQVHYR